MSIMPSLPYSTCSTSGYGHRRYFDLSVAICRTLRLYIIDERTAKGDAYATFRDNLLKLHMKLRDRDFRVRDVRRYSP